MSSAAILQKTQISADRTVFVHVSKSRNGMYHRGIPARCNQNMKVGLASHTNVEAASARMFCEKCFPNGKPSLVCEG